MLLPTIHCILFGHVILSICTANQSGKGKTMISSVIHCPITVLNNDDNMVNHFQINE